MSLMSGAVLFGGQSAPVEAANLSVSGSDYAITQDILVPFAINSDKTTNGAKRVTTKNNARTDNSVGKTTIKQKQINNTNTNIDQSTNIDNSRNEHRFSYSLDGRHYFDAGAAFDMREGFWKGIRVGLYAYHTKGDSQTLHFDNFVYDILR